MKTETFWTKNRFTVISMSVYLMMSILFGSISTPNVVIFILSLLTLPLIYNMKIDSKSIKWLIVAGFTFGLYLIPFDTHSGNLYTKISYFTLLVSLNIFYHLHRGDYLRRKNQFELIDKRDVRIDEILHPVKKKFFQ